MDSYTAFNCLMNLMSSQVQSLHAAGPQNKNPLFHKKKRKRMRENSSNSAIELNPTNRNNGSNINKYPKFINNKNKSFMNTHFSKFSDVCSTDNFNKTSSFKNKGNNMNTKHSLQNMKTDDNTKTNPNLKNKKEDSSVKTQASIYPKGLFKKNHKICTICNKHFTSLKQAKDHYGGKKHTAEFELYKLRSVPFVQCKFCEKKFYMKKTYKAHLYHHRRMKMMAEKREENVEIKKSPTNSTGACIPDDTNSCLQENREDFSSIGSTDLEVSSLNAESASVTGILNHTEKELFEISRECIVTYLTKDADPVLGTMVERAPIFTGSDAIDLLEKAIKYVVLDKLWCSFCKKIFGNIEICEMHLVSTSHDENVAKAKTLLINGTFAYHEEFKNCMEMNSSLNLAGSASTVPVPQHVNSNLPSSFQIFTQGEGNNVQRNCNTMQQHESISKQVPKTEGKNLPLCFEMNPQKLKEDKVTPNRFGEILKGKIKERNRVNSESSSHSDVNAKLFQIAHQNLSQESIERHQNLSDFYDNDRDLEPFATDLVVTKGSKNNLYSSNQHKFTKNRAQRNCKAVEKPGYIQRLAAPKIEQVSLSVPSQRANIAPPRQFECSPMRQLEEPNHEDNEALRLLNVNARLFQIANQNLSNKFDGDCLSSNSFDDIALDSKTGSFSTRQYNIHENNVKINPKSFHQSKYISRIPPRAERELHYEAKPNKLSEIDIVEFKHFEDMSARRSNISEPLYNKSQNQADVNARLIQLAHQNNLPPETLERNHNLSGSFEDTSRDPNHFLSSISECSKLKQHFKNSSCSSYYPEEFQLDRENPYRREKELPIASSNSNRENQPNKRCFQNDYNKNKDVYLRDRHTNHYKDELPFSDRCHDHYINKNCRDRSTDEHTKSDDYHLSQSRCLSQHLEYKATTKPNYKFCEDHPSGNFKQNKSAFIHSPEMTKTIPHYTVHFTG